MKDLPDDIRLLIENMRKIGSDTQQCEVKESVQQLPKSLPETLSAFANRAGGIVILGLSEKNGFKPTKGFDAKKIFTAMMNIGDALTPVCRLDVEILPFEGAHIVVARVPEIAFREKPCYVTRQGMYLGSYIRTGDGDRRLTEYEVDRLKETHLNPKFDIECVPNADITDLDSDILKAIVRRQKVTTNYFATLSEEEILIKLGALARYNGELKPTLGGLLVAGHFPQEIFPRLNVTFTVYPGTNKAQSAGEKYRYLDSQAINGSIPEMLQSSIRMLHKNMRTGALIDGAFRENVPEYPVLAFREALVNALQHRDYSEQGRSSQVQVNLYADHLEILSPGGLYGAASIDSMAPGISSTRNMNLSRLLENTPSRDSDDQERFVIENRGTGLIQIRESLAHALMPPAKIENFISAFSITFYKRSLTEEEAPHTRWTNIERALINELTHRASLSMNEIVNLSGVNRRTIFKYLNELLDRNIIERTEPARSPKQRYRLKR